MSSALQHTESGNSPPAPTGALRVTRSGKGMPAALNAHPEPTVARTAPLPELLTEVQPGVALGDVFGYASGLPPIAAIGHGDTPSEVGNLQRDSFQENSTPVDHSTVVEYSTAIYLTFAQVADLLQVTPGTVSSWSLRDATFPVTRLPGRVMRVERRALDRWLRRCGRKTS